MRRIFTLLVLLFALSFKSWATWPKGGILYFPETIVDIPVSQSLDPDGDGINYYRQYVWWCWEEDFSDTPFALNNPDYEDDFIWSVEVTGDITLVNKANNFISVNGKHYELNSSEIYFTGSSGIITVTATNPDFGDDHKAYTASYIINYHLDIKNKNWDFYTKRMTIADWDGSHWSAASYMGSDDSPLIRTYKQGLSYNGTQPNSAIEDMDGLKVDANSECFGIYNDDDNQNVSGIRYVGLKKGAKLYIPKETWNGYTNPRIRIKMARYGDNTMHLGITNGKDALGNVINTDYCIGGSVWWGDKGDNHQRGEYHFQLQSRDQDFAIEVKSDYWLMLYTIEVYDSEEMITENSVLGTRYQYLHTQYIDGDEVLTGDYYIHYRGKAEKTKIDVNSYTVSGTVQKDINRFTKNDGSFDENIIPKHTYTSYEGEFGSFRMRLDVYTHDKKYCTDWAYRTMSVGYMQKKAYPYTWDFTDIKKYKEENFKDDNGVETLKANKWALESQNGYAQQPENNYVTGVTYIPRNVWNEDGSFRIAHNSGNYNLLFAGGSQLWYGKTIIPETAGLAFTPVNFDGDYNGALTLTKDGLKFAQNNRDWWLWRIMIPNVDSECTIYVRARRLPQQTVPNPLYNNPKYPNQPETIDIPFYNVGYYYGDATNSTEKSLFSTAALNITATAREIAVDDNSGDVIYAIPAPSQTTNVTLFFTGVEVHKIAVSKDPKTVNKYGWATESRDRVIDQELTSYFTGKDFVTYLVDEVNSSNTSVKLSDVTMTSNVMEKSNGSDYNAYIIRNKDAEILKDENGNVVKDENDEVVATGKVDILKTGGGFHLFVPDIHDYVKIGENTSDYNQKSVNTYKPLLRAKLNAGPVNKNETIDGVDYTNFVLTWQVADITEGQQGSQYDFENVGFFRVQDAGIQSKGNQGYLPLILASGNTTNKYNIVWDDDTNGIDATITDNVARRNDNVFYNLSGQRLNGVPTKGGIYIVNGKKIVVK